MAILTIMATSHTSSTGVFTWSTLGFMLLTIGLIATYFSSRRYLLGYLAGGMGYWVVVEGIQSILVNMTAISTSLGYGIALLITWVALAAMVSYRYKQLIHHHHLQPKRGVESLSSQRSFTKSVVNKIWSLKARGHVKMRKQQDKYIEHTPVYNKYKPRFRN